MNFAVNIPALSILLLMLSGIVCLVLPARGARHVADCAIALACAMSAVLLFAFVRGQEVFTYSMGEIGAPFGNELRAGPLEAAVATLFSVVTLLSILGGRAHLRTDIGRQKVNLYYISVLFLLCSMLALVYTNDLFTAYVFVEINTITACGIVMSKEDGYTLAASMRYFIMSLIGSGLFLIAVSILYALTGHLLMSDIQEEVASLYAQGLYRAPLQVAIALMGVGLSLKSALWPFSSWLPDAHSSASASSSAMLSGLVL
ncbi:MAG: sodium:proton antiporter, partial [Firmicutes bacterium]|nr:sodium:proton antiporter [Bacillota bacterium]